MAFYKLSHNHIEPGIKNIRSHGTPASLQTNTLGSTGPALPAVTLLLCAFALFIACYGSWDHDPVIQLNTEETMLGAGGHGIHAGSLSVWKKNILMGGKCQLPDFSGVIIYDSDGNVVTPAKNPRPYSPGSEKQWGL
ncbi:Acetate kinase [Salix suchowensis]|nr:Acetate kinase [Salix suchowensis]